MQELFFEQQRSISVGSKATTQLKVHTATEGTVFVPAWERKRLFGAGMEMKAFQEMTQML